MTSIRGSLPRQLDSSLRAKQAPAAAPVVPATVPDFVRVAASRDFGASGGPTLTADAALAGARRDFSHVEGVLKLRLGFTDSGGPAVVVVFDPARPIPDLPARTGGYPLVLEANAQ